MTPATEDALVQGFVRNLTMTLSAVATRYAKALADVTTASSAALKPADALTQLRAFEAALNSSHELQNALSYAGRAGEPQARSGGPSGGPSASSRRSRAIFSLC
jgi:hypothetical protein